MLVRRGESGLLFPDPGITVARAPLHNYSDKALNLSRADVLGYWRLTELSGTNADSYEGTSARDGTFARDVSTMGTQPGIGDGYAAPDFDGANDFVDVYSASLNSGKNLDEGTVATWMQMSASGIWTDSTRHDILSMLWTTSFDDAFQIQKTTTDNQLLFYRKANQVATQVLDTSLGGSTAWHHVGMTWSQSANELKAYIDGSQVGSTQTASAATADALHSGLSVIGANDTTPAEWHSGPLAHAILLTTPLTSAQMAILATVP